jgi:hypothetical protein
MLKFIKKRNGFKSYQADGFRIYYGEKGSVAGDNNISPAETIYLVSGEMEVTIKDKITKYIAPAEFEVPDKTYHKLESKTKTTFLLFD